MGTFLVFKEIRERGRSAGRWTRPAISRLIASTFRISASSSEGRKEEGWKEEGWREEGRWKGTPATRQPLDEHVCFQTAENK